MGVAAIDKEGGEHLPLHDEVHVRNAIAHSVLWAA